MLPLFTFSSSPLSNSLALHGSLPFLNNDATTLEFRHVSQDLRLVREFFCGKCRRERVVALRASRMRTRNECIDITDGLGSVEARREASAVCETDLQGDDRLALVDTRRRQRLHAIGVGRRCRSGRGCSDSTSTRDRAAETLTSPGKRFVFLLRNHVFLALVSVELDIHLLSRPDVQYVERRTATIDHVQDTGIDWVVVTIQGSFVDREAVIPDMQHPFQSSFRAWSTCVWIRDCFTRSVVASQSDACPGETSLLHWLSTGWRTVSIRDQLVLWPEWTRLVCLTFVQSREVAGYDLLPRILALERQGLTCLLQQSTLGHALRRYRRQEQQTPLPADLADSSLASWSVMGEVQILQMSVPRPTRMQGGRPGTAHHRLLVCVDRIMVFVKSCCHPHLQRRWPRPWTHRSLSPLH